MAWGRLQLKTDNQFLNQISFKASKLITKIIKIKIPKLEKIETWWNDVVRTWNEDFVIVKNRRRRRRSCWWVDGGDDAVLVGDVDVVVLGIMHRHVHGTGSAQRSRKHRTAENGGDDGWNPRRPNEIWERKLFFKMGGKIWKESISIVYVSIYLNTLAPQI